MPGVTITGYGQYLPEEVVTNQALSIALRRQLKALQRANKLPVGTKLADLTTSSRWINERTGVRKRHRVRPGEVTSDLAALAVKDCQDMSGLAPDNKGFLLVATVSPDHVYSPPTAAIVQHKLGWPVTDHEGNLIDRLVCDETAACSSYLTALAQGEALIRSGNRRCGYVVGADTMSTTINPLRRDIAVILGDGAFALSLEATNNPGLDCFLPNGKSFMSGSDGQYADLIMAKAGGAAKPIDIEILLNPLCADHKIQMQGRAVFKILVGLCRDKVIPQALDRAGLRLKDIDLFLFHQANLRMIDAITEPLHIQRRTVNNIQEVGNTTSASIGLALIKAIRTGKLQPGMLVMITVMGGGLTWGTCILRWPNI